MADTNTNKPQDAKPSFSTSQAGAAVKESARNAADAMQQGGRSTADAMRNNADAAADVARRGGEAGADAMNRAGETASDMTRKGTQALVESQRQIAQDAAQRFEEVSRKIAQATQGTSENVRRLMTLPNAAEGGLRDMQQGVTGLFEGVVQTNLRVAQELFRLANPAPFVELQQRFVREYTDTLVQNSATLVRAMRRTADETLRPLEEQIRQRGQDNQADARFQTAAE
ncbi:hypothetical protein GCM10009416_42550 [Craurococcus roseus]|uniref:Phasin domain-containing protein n=1 Tax=Craurococcus roseus TaxID=77585 RepID=A0ABN1FXN3_9PROT